jgi:hypothetical protein
MKVRPALLSAILILSLSSRVYSEPVAVKHASGVMRGFVVLHSATGSLLGHGEYTESREGARTTARLTLRFRDGSLDDETASFTTDKVFRFLGDHHVQRGPFFKTAIDMTIDEGGQVTLKTMGSNGKEKVETNQINLPNDVSNGILGAMLLDIPHGGADTTVSMVLPSGKGRVAKLVITPEGTQTFSPVVGDRQKADLFRIHIDLGGIAGIVAPVIGKQPSDLTAWVLEGEVPVLVREVGQLAEGGPVVSMELAGTSYSRK